MASTDLLIDRYPANAEFPAANFGQLNVRNNQGTIDLDAATKETIYFPCALPGSLQYSGGGLTVKVLWKAATATSGNAVLLSAIERQDIGGLDTDADSFAADQTVTTAAPGTSGVLASSTMTFSAGAAMDSAVAGEKFRLRVERDAANVADTMTGDLQIDSVLIFET